MTTVDVSRLAGFTELSEALHVKRSTIMGWHYRRTSRSQWDNGTGFPEDIRIQDGLPRLVMGPVFDLAEVVQWYIDWESPRNKAKGVAKLGYVDDVLLKELGIDNPELEQING